MFTKKPNDNSFIGKITSFIKTSFFNSGYNQIKEDTQDKEDNGDGDNSGIGKNKPDELNQENTQVKDPKTPIYDAIKEDPAAMAALQKLTNGQIPSSEAAAIFEKVKNSEVALDAIINSEFAPSDVKSKAREEKAHQQRKKLNAQPGFKKPPPKPPGF